jgi:hypothetical protein
LFESLPYGEIGGAVTFFTPYIIGIDVGTQEMALQCAVQDTFGSLYLAGRELASETGWEGWTELKSTKFDSPSDHHNIPSFRIKSNNTFESLVMDDYHFRDESHDQCSGLTVGDGAAASAGNLKRQHSQFFAISILLQL